MADFIDDADRLNALADAEAPRFRRRFLSLVQNLRERRTISEILDLIQAGQIQAIPPIASLEAGAAQLAGLSHETFISAALRTAAVVQDALGDPAALGFDATSYRAVQAMRDNRLRLIRGLTDESRDVIGQILTRGLQERRAPMWSARLIRDSIGLTPYQESVVANYRRALEQGDTSSLSRALRDRRSDRAVVRAATLEQPLSADRIDRMVDRYRQRWINFRAETIAITESARAVHQGTEELYRQAVESGVLDPDELVREWRTREDEKRRPSHRAMHRQRRKLGEPFVSGAGNLLRYPIDPEAPAEETARCRCSLKTTFRVPGADQPSPDQGTAAPPGLERLAVTNTVTASGPFVLAGRDADAGRGLWVLKPKPFEDAWRRDIENYVTRAGTGRSTVGGRIEGFGRFVEDRGFVGIEAGRVAVNVLESGLPEVSFVDGRHRTRWMLNHIGEIPGGRILITMDPEDALVALRFGLIEPRLP